MGHVPTALFEEFDLRQGLAAKARHFEWPVLTPAQLEVRPVEWPIPVDRVPGDGEVVELVLVDLDLLAVEVEKDRAVGEVGISSVSQATQDVVRRRPMSPARRVPWV